MQEHPSTGAKTNDTMGTTGKVEEAGHSHTMQQQEVDSTKGDQVNEKLEAIFWTEFLHFALGLKR